MDIREESLQLHGEWKGKIEVISTVPVKNKKDLSLAYTPGVAEPCLAVQKDVDLSYKYTKRWNLVAVVTDGTAVLGLGDIGPEAGMPVMEGKCVLFKTFGNVDAFPLCIKSKDVDDIVNTVQLISGSFGGINLEDISAPRCFEIERRLKEVCDIPIFHDDQHGTAVIVLAAMINALKIAKKDIKEVSVVVNGSGAAGIAVTRLLMSMGLKHVILCDTKGAIYEGRDNLNDEKALMAKISNLEKKKGTLKDVMVGADIFIGVSAPGTVTQQMVKDMAKDPIIFAMANPTPEIMPDEAKQAGAFIVGTGRSDLPNQVNNVLAFPGVFLGAIQARAHTITNEMKIEAAFALAECVENPTVDNILPSPLDKTVAPRIAKRVEEAYKNSPLMK